METDNVPHIAFLIFIVFAASTAISLSLDPPQVPTSPTNVSITSATFNASSPANQSIRPPALTYSTPPLNHSGGNLSRYGFYSCSDTTFGHPTLKSCREALLQMPNSWQRSTYGDRTAYGGEDVDFPLPVRYVSGDGTCVIEIFASSEGGIDMLEPSQLKRSIRHLIDKCMGEGKMEGGVVKWLGEKDRLSGFVQQSTTKVKCFAPTGLAPKEPACGFPLNTMPVSASMELFGEKGTSDVDVGLPLRYTGPSDECAIDVMIEGPPIKASWYDLWGAAAIIVAVCARLGEDGVVTRTVGESELAVWVSCGDSLGLSGSTLHGFPGAVAQNVRTREAPA